MESKRNFNDEKNHLIALINKAHVLQNEVDGKKHPVFGEFTAEQWGKMQYKHLNHHFSQFGI